MRFGNDLEACLKAIQIGFELSPRPSDSVYQGAVKTLEMVQTPPSLSLCLSLQEAYSHRRTLVYAGHSLNTCSAEQEGLQAQNTHTACTQECPHKVRVHRMHSSQHAGM